MKQLVFNNSSSYEKSSWKRVKLSDVAEEYSTRIENPSLSEYGFYIGSDCIGQYDFRIHKKADASTITSTQKGFKQGDYLLVRRSLYGSDFRERAPRADFDGVCSADILTIREKTGVVEDGFLIYVLYQKDFWDFIVSNSTGGLTRRIKWKQLADYEFELPPLDIQKVIANKLWSAYRLKESYKHLLTATQEMVKSRFIEMVGDPRSNPKGWKIKKLPDIASYSIGLTYKPEQLCEDGTIVLRSGNIQEGEIDLQDLVRVNAPIRDNLWVKEGDILMCSRNGSASLVGKVAQIKSIVEPMTYGAFMTIIRSEYSDYLYMYFQSGDFRDQISSGKSSTMNQITQKMLDKIEIPIPNQEVISTLSAILHQTDKSVFEIKKSIEAIDAVIKSLING